MGVSHIYTLLSARHELYPSPKQAEYLRYTRLFSKHQNNQLKRKHFYSNNICNQFATHIKKGVDALDMFYIVLITDLPSC